MTAPGMCRACKHWYTDGERFRSWAGECLHVCSPLHMSQTDADDTCPVWEPLFKRHPTGHRHTYRPWAR